jgi:methyl-accepting chemotaxis protein
MTIANRLLMLVAVSVSCLALLAGLAAYQTERVYQAANFSNENVVPSMILLDKAILEMGRLRVRVYRHAVSEDPKIVADTEVKITEAKQALEKALKDYEAFLADEEDKRLLLAEKKDLAEYLKDVEQVLAVSRRGEHAAARDLMNKFAEHAEKTNNALVEHMNFNVALSKKGSDEAVAAKRAALWQAITITVLAMLALATLGLLIVRHLTSRISEANRIAERIASGDLGRDGSFVGERDEVGQLLASLEKMRADLATTIGEIVSQAHSLAASSNQLSSTATQVAASSESQAEATSAAAAAVEELTVSIDHVGNSADDSSLRAKDAEAKSIASGKDVDQASSHMELVATRVEHTSEQIRNLSEGVQKIGNITVVIREVADQTNLLALNAAIEAARAGEQGRGFAVVADEVRKLAERTTLSVQEISAMISTIQAGAISAVESMESSQQEVGSVVSAANRAGVSMRDIRTAAETVQEAVASISAALREQRSASVELSRNVEAIAQMSDQNSAAIGSVAHTAHDLVAVSDRLKRCAERFRL